MSPAVEYPATIPWFARSIWTIACTPSAICSSVHSSLFELLVPTINHCDLRVRLVKVLIQQLSEDILCFIGRVAEIHHLPNTKEFVEFIFPVAAPSCRDGVSDDEIFELSIMRIEGSLSFCVCIQPGLIDGDALARASCRVVCYFQFFSQLFITWRQLSSEN